MQKNALCQVVRTFLYRLIYEHKSNNIWCTQAIHVLILPAPFTTHSLYRETMQILLNVSNILFKLTKNELYLRAQIRKLSVQI